MCGAVWRCGDPLSAGCSGNAASINIISFSRRVTAVVSPLMGGLALSSGLGLAFFRKVFQQASFARLMALRRSHRAALVALVLFDRPARLALPSSFLSSEISSNRSTYVWSVGQTLLGLANSSRMPAAVSRIHLASPFTPWHAAVALAAAPVGSDAGRHLSSHVEELEMQEEGSIGADIRWCI